MKHSRLPAPRHILLYLWRVLVVALVNATVLVMLWRAAG